MLVAHCVCYYHYYIVFALCHLFQFVLTKLLFMAFGCQSLSKHNTIVVVVAIIIIIIINLNNTQTPWEGRWMKIAGIIYC